MKVFCIEGVHGSGKSYICNLLAKYYGLHVLDEAFLPTEPTNKTEHLPSSDSSQKKKKVSPSCVFGSNDACNVQTSKEYQMSKKMKSYPQEGCESPINNDHSNHAKPNKSKVPTVLHPQSLIKEMMWTSHWFERLLKIKQFHTSRIHQEGNQRKTSPPLVFVADRSPYSAVFYTQKQHGHLLKPLIDQMIHDLKHDAGIEVITVFLSVHKDKLWERIQQRLCKEPSRMAFNEHNRAWMEQVWDLYNQFDKWDLVISNDTDEDIAPQMKQRIDQFLKRQSSEANTFSPCKKIVAYC